MCKKYLDLSRTPIARAALVVSRRRARFLLSIQQRGNASFRGARPRRADWTLMALAWPPWWDKDQA